MSRPTEITIDLAALRNNCLLAQSLAPKGKTVAVIKADAYGHGAADIANALKDNVAMFAVSCLEEGLDIRQADIQNPILLLEGCFSADELVIAQQANMQPVVHNQQQVEMLQALQIDGQIKVWLKLDTGMHRLGIAPQHAMENFLALQACENVSEIVILSHLSNADNLDDRSTQTQLEIFSSTFNALNQVSSVPLQCSIANSAAVLAWPQSHGNWDRPGIMLYGLSPFDGAHQYASNLQPVMTFKSKIIALREVKAGDTVGYGNTWQAIRDSIVATVAVGYGDGYPRNAKSGTPVLVNGQRVSLCGRVSMDMITLDVTELSRVNIGDDVELWGSELSANEVAAWAGTIGYELVTRMPKRTRRRIINSLP